MALLLCEHLTLGYDGKPVFEDLSFSVSAGEYLCIVGANGAGKSTLMQALLGMLTPMAGTITTGDGLRANEIGYLPQQNDMQKDFPASVFEIVLSGCLNRMGKRPFYSGRDKATARQALQRLNIENLSGCCYRELSGGQQQRVLLARALCATQRLLLLDEPVAGLDPVATRDMYALIRRLNAEGVTVIMVSHDMREIVKQASHILHVGPSKAFFGTTADYQQSNFARLWQAEAGGAEND